MKLIVNGDRVELHYLHFYEPGISPLVQVKVAGFTESGKGLHKLIKSWLLEKDVHVMDNEEVGTDGYSEIRILQGTKLKIIDLLRACGAEVIEVT